MPTQRGPRGLLNQGCRVLAPESGGQWRVRLSDLDTGNTLFESSAEFAAGLVRSSKRYFVRFRIEAWQGDERVFTHDYDARRRDVISGFTHPINEFATPYRIINYHVCKSCWNDPLQLFDQGDFLRCPRHKGTARQFECTRSITAEQVKMAIRRIPAFNA